jgi:hypothetical protein
MRYTYFISKFKKKDPFPKVIYCIRVLFLAEIHSTVPQKHYNLENAQLTRIIIHYFAKGNILLFSDKFNIYLLNYTILNYKLSMRNRSMKIIITFYEIFS